MRFSFMVVWTMFLLGCASHAKPISSEGTAKTHAVHQSVKHSELIVMLCSQKDYAEAQHAWQQEGLTLVKRLSPTVLTLTWSGQRDAKQVMQSLKQYSVFHCGVEENQVYQMIKEKQEYKE